MQYSSFKDNLIKLEAKQCCITIESLRVNCIIVCNVTKNHRKRLFQLIRVVIEYMMRSVFMEQSKEHEKMQEERVKYSKCPENPLAHHCRTDHKRNPLRPRKVVDAMLHLSFSELIERIHFHFVQIPIYS